MMRNIDCCHCHCNFLYPNVLKWCSFQKNRTGIWSFLYYEERWYFFFPKIWHFFLDRKGNLISLKNIHGDMMFSSNVLKRWSFQKIVLEHDLFGNIWEDSISFFPKIYFFFRRKLKDYLSHKIHGNMLFSVYVHKCYKYDTSLLIKKTKITLSRKNTLKGDISGITEEGDIYPRKYDISVEIPRWLTF